MAYFWREIADATSATPRGIDLAGREGLSISSTHLDRHPRTCGMTDMGWCINNIYHVMKNYTVITKCSTATDGSNAMVIAAFCRSHPMTDDTGQLTNRNRQGTRHEIALNKLTHQLH